MATVHVQFQARVVGGRVWTAELCDSHARRYLNDCAGGGWSVHIRHLAA